MKCPTTDSVLVLKTGSIGLQLMKDSRQPGKFTAFIEFLLYLLYEEDFSDIYATECHRHGKQQCHFEAFVFLLVLEMDLAVLLFSAL